MSEHPAFGKQDPDDVTAVVQRRHVVLSRNRLLIVLGIAFSISALVSIGAALYLVYQTQSQPPVGEEEPLALYSYANELFVKGEDAASLRVLQRAKRITTDERALAQIDALERRIVDTGKLQAGRADQGPEPSDESTLAGGATDTLEPDSPAGASPAEAADAAESTAGAIDDSAAEKVARTADPSPTASETETGARQRPVVTTNGREKGWLAISANAEARIWIDGAPTNRVTPARLRLPAGRHALTLQSMSAPERQVSRRVRVVAGRMRRLRLELPPPAKDESAEKTTAARRPSRGERARIGTMDAERSKAAIGLIGASDPIPAPPPTQPAD
jgi:hypothetical protein